MRANVSSRSLQRQLFAHSPVFPRNETPIRDLCEFQNGVCGRAGSIRSNRPASEIFKKARRLSRTLREQRPVFPRFLEPSARAFRTARAPRARGSRSRMTKSRHKEAFTRSLVTNFYIRRTRLRHCVFLVISEFIFLSFSFFKPMPRCHR